MRVRFYFLGCSRSIGPLFKFLEQSARNYGDVWFGEFQGGWLDRFRFRNAISFKRLHGEAAEIDDDALRQWQENERWTALERYTADQIYNAVETGVFDGSTKI